MEKQRLFLNIADPEEVAVFGDSGNSMELLQKAGFSFAMNNVNDITHQVARYSSAAANNDKGVLETIDHILNGHQDSQAT
ncbi:HAD hydrolase family protein [Endozoicomonas sp. YOMI1]|uniref:HAD hydrolase family protein n=1 Tax=Endozoicomonas sp. YOMI1 TaxID=2828739 RepID=UPI002148327C|nr:HAD hydrolase family protein [Endozoicomonas sp. YOMI1]